jgi:hypothetical protein
MCAVDGKQIGTVQSKDLCSKSKSVKILGIDADI